MTLLVLNDARFAELAMEAAHQKAHNGVDATVIQFRTNGFWTVRAGIMAKKVKSKCVTCRYLDKSCLKQTMRIRSKEFALCPRVWQHIEFDLFRPFSCWGDKNLWVIIKVRGMVFKDINSGAVHLDIV